jgi:predicted alpha/beta hydrolase family esterase
MGKEIIDIEYMSQKNVYIIHGFGSCAEKGWRSWLRDELVSRGYRVVMPDMPNPEFPMMWEWLAKLHETIIDPDENTILVGHSLGAQAILRFAETLTVGVKIGKLITVAGFIQDANVDEGMKDLLGHWIENPVDPGKVKANVGEIVSFFSDNDKLIPLESEVIMREKFGARTIIEHNMYHYNNSCGIMQVPKVLEEILK